jgi:hypothetical protein
MLCGCIVPPLYANPKYATLSDFRPEVTVLPLLDAREAKDFNLFYLESERFQQLTAGLEKKRFKWCFTQEMGEAYAARSMRGMTANNEAVQALGVLEGPILVNALIEIVGTNPPWLQHLVPEDSAWVLMVTVHELRRTFDLLFGYAVTARISGVLYDESTRDTIWVNEAAYSYDDSLVDMAISGENHGFNEALGSAMEALMYSLPE